MDYNLVLKFKKYPAEKPSKDKLYLVIAIGNEYCSEHIISERSGYFDGNGVWETAYGEKIIAFCEYPSNNKLIELLNSNKETILVTKQYLERLEYSDNLLSALHEAGVENWCGYDEAIDMVNL